MAQVRSLPTLARLSQRTRWRLVVGIVAVAALVAACGSDTDDAASAESAAVSESNPSVPTPTAVETSGADGEASDTVVDTTEDAGEIVTPTGEPITILTAGPYTNPAGKVTESPGAAVEAHAAVLNAQGGIGGRPIEVIVCDTGLDQVKELDCIRQAIDADAAAVVGYGATTDTLDELTLLEEAGIPSLGHTVVDRPSVSSPISYPLSGGAIGQVVAAPTVLASAGSSNVALLIPDVSGPAIAQLEQIWGLGVGNSGLENSGFFRVPLDSTDLSPMTAAALSGGVDGLGVNLPGELLLRLLQSLDQQADDVPIVIVGGAPDDELITSAGDINDGLKILLSHPSPSSSEVPGIARLVEEITAYDASADIDDDVINAWLSTYIFGVVAKELVEAGGTVDGASMREALDATSNFDTLGLTPPLDFTTPFTGIPGAERLFNPSVTVMTVREGEIVLDDPADPFVSGFDTAG